MCEKSRNPNGRALLRIGPGAVLAEERNVADDEVLPVRARRIGRVVEILVGVSAPVVVFLEPIGADATVLGQVPIHDDDRVWPVLPVIREEMYGLSGQGTQRDIRRGRALLSGCEEPLAVALVEPESRWIQPPEARSIADFVVRS